MCIVVPVFSPCMQLQDYALGELKSKTHSGIVVIKRTANDATYILPSRISASKFHHITVRIGVHFLIGGILEVILLWLIAIGVIKWQLKHCIDQSYSYSYQYYGLMWGVTVIGFITATLLFYGHISVVKQLLLSDDGDKRLIIPYIFGIAMGILPGLPIAIYFSYKTAPPAIPYILMIPVAVLFCCCNTKHVKSLLFGTALWINMVAFQSVLITLSLTLFAVLAKPFAVITNTLVLILLTLSLTNITALAFTISAYIFTPKHKRPQGGGRTMFNAVALILLMAIICCFCAAFGSNGYVINVDTKQGTFVSLTASVVIPLLLGTVTFGLQKLITILLRKPLKKTQYIDMEEEEE